MIKHMITATSFALGGAGAVLVGYLSTHPMAFTHRVTERPPAVSRAAAVAPVVEPTGNTIVGNAILLPEVLITASGKKAQKQAVLPARLDPCSEWSDVGAMFIDPAGATGVRRVRALCEQPGGER
jgi:hypothetical protein